MAFAPCFPAGHTRAGEAMSSIDANGLQTDWLSDCVEQFRCIGPACEESCCGGWQITMDEPTLVVLRGLPDPEVRDVLAASVREFPAQGAGAQNAGTQRTGTQIGWIELRRDGSCPFLNAEQWCLLQARHGEAAMPLGCRVYPRVHHRIDGRRHSALSLSCPEAARRVLAAEVAADANSGSAEGFAPTAAVLAEAAAGLPQRATRRVIFWPLLRVHQALVRDRSLPMAARMLRMGQLAQILDAQPDGNAAAGLRAFCLAADRVGRDAIEAGMDSGEVAAEPLEFLLAAMDRALGFAAHNQRFRALTAKVLRGLQYQPGADLRPRCQRLRAEKLEPVLAAHPEWMENLLCNELLRRLYPLGMGNGSDGCAMDEFARLSLEWAWVRLYLIGVCGDGPLELAQAAECVQSLTRAVFARTEEFGALCRAWREQMQRVPLARLLCL